MCLDMSSLDYGLEVSSGHHCIRWEVSDSAEKPVSVLPTATSESDVLSWSASDTAHTTKGVTPSRT